MASEEDLKTRQDFTQWGVKGIAASKREQHVGRFLAEKEPCGLATFLLIQVFPPDQGHLEGLHGSPSLYLQAQQSHPLSPVISHWLLHLLSHVKTRGGGLGVNPDSLLSSVRRQGRDMI